MAGIQLATSLKIPRLEQSTFFWSPARARTQNHFMLSPVFKLERSSWWKDRKNSRKRWTSSKPDPTNRASSNSQRLSRQTSSSSKKKSRSQSFTLSRSNTLCPPSASTGSCWAIKGIHCSSDLDRNSVQPRHNWLLHEICLPWIPFVTNHPVAYLPDTN